MMDPRHTKHPKRSKNFLTRIQQRVTILTLALALVVVYLLELRAHELQQKALTARLQSESREVASIITNELQKKQVLIHKLHLETSRHIRSFEHTSDELFDWLSVLNKNSPDFADFRVYSPDGQLVGMSSKSMFRYLNRNQWQLHKSNIKDIAASVGRDSTLILGPIDTEVYGRVLVFVRSFFDPLTGNISGYFEGIYLWSHMKQLFNESKASVKVVNTQNSIILDVYTLKKHSKASQEPQILAIADVTTEEQEHLGWQVRASAPFQKASFWPLSEASQITLISLVLAATVMQLLIWFELRSFSQLSGTLMNHDLEALAQLLEKSRTDKEAKGIARYIFELLDHTNHVEQELRDHKQLLAGLAKSLSPLFVIMDEQDQVICGTDEARSLFEGASYLRSDRTTMFPHSLNPINCCRIDEGPITAEVYMTNAQCAFERVVLISAAAFKVLEYDRCYKLVLLLDIDDRRRALDQERAILRAVA